MSEQAVRTIAISVMLIAGGMHASAQTAPPTEDVTVMGSRSALHDFSRTFGAPTMVTGKIARWEHRICPIVVGQSPSYSRFITQRVQYVAMAAKAPVNTDASCTPNVEIIFTTTPQDLVDTVRGKTPYYLGYATSNAQREHLATVTRPVQAWYATETTDLKGRRHLDTGRPIVNGNNIMNMSGPANSRGGDILSNTPGNILDLPPFYASNGNHLNDGIHTGFNHILIVVDSSKLSGQEIVPLADYISMLALTQLNSLDACQELPSIANRMARDCGHQVDGLTMYDLAYLQALYHMSTGRNVVLQRSEIGELMTDALEGKVRR